MESYLILRVISEFIHQQLIFDFSHHTTNRHVIQKRLKFFMPRYFILYEHSVGISLFDCKGFNELSVSDKSVQKRLIEFTKFSQIVSLFAFQPFSSAEEQLETMTLLTEGQASSFIIDFLSRELPDSGKGNFTLGISDPKLAASVQQSLGVSCQSDDVIREVIRAIRLHFGRFMEDIAPEDLSQAQLGLAHSYSRAKVKFNQHGDDNMVISAVALLGIMDKDINTFSMRLREWYSVHFPELSALVEDHKLYAKCVQLVAMRSNTTSQLSDELTKILENPDLARKIVEASDNSIGREIDEIDLSRIISMAARVESLADYRDELTKYLYNRMHNISPNLTSLIGERMGAQLIMASGSLTNLAKAPASTVQLLGAEKALFNAMKKRKKTPKYGMIFQSGPVSHAAPKDKGRIARTFANKISIAARIDAFSDEFRSGHLGLMMKEMMDHRLNAIATHSEATPNLEDMEAAVKETRRYEQNEGAEEALNPDGMTHHYTEFQPSTETHKSAENAQLLETPKRRRKKHRHHHEEQNVENVTEEAPAETAPAATEEPASTSETTTPRRRRKHRSSAAVQE